MLPISVIVRAHRFTHDGMEPVELSVSAEYHVALLLNGNPLLKIACSGTDLDLLAVGHLLSEGIVLTRKEIARVDVDEERLSVNVVLSEGVDVSGRLARVRTIFSGSSGTPDNACAGRPGGCDLPRIDAQVVLNSVREFLGLSSGHRTTHGVHGGALYDMNGLRRAFYEEIGRHNAVDKLLGFSLVSDIRLDRAMLFSTGRVSSEIVHKAASAGIPVIVTRAAPTSMAVTRAREKNIILLTGAREDSFYVHNGAEYIAL